MASRFSLGTVWQRAASIAAGGAILCIAGFAAASARPDEPMTEIVGAIEGEVIAVQGPMSVEVVRGQVKTILHSGSDVRVKSGQARIDLAEGGQITICGPAHLSVLKSGDALTLALDSGTIHAHIEGEPALTVYTAQIQAKPVAIGDGPQDALFGFDATGAMCIRANRGAVRIEQQLTGQSVLVPQGGDVLLVNGQIDGLHTSASRCSCELQIVKAAPPEISRIATAEEVHNKAVETRTAAPPSPAPSNPSGDPGQAGVTPGKDEPVYQVFMPPLSYDVNAKVQRDFDPNLIVLVRRVRVRPTLIFQGRVEGDPVIAANTTPAAANTNAQTAPKANAAPAASSPNDSMLNRVRTFFRRLWTRNS